MNCFLYLFQVSCQNISERKTHEWQWRWWTNLDSCRHTGRCARTWSQDSVPSSASRSWLWTQEDNAQHICQHRENDHKPDKYNETRITRQTYSSHV